MICFEEFDTEEIYPVVLPCGHTYVCNLCAERLDKCMECRTPLYTTAPRPAGHLQNSPASTAGRSPWSSARSGSGTPQHQHQRQFSPSQHHPPPIKKRLPLPKNVVLLSLIEATELATQNVQKKYSGSPVNNDTSQRALQSMPSMVDAGEEEEEKIKMSTSLAVSVSGTYAVACQEGLDIFPSRPTSLPQTIEAVNDEDVDALVRFFHMDNKAAESRADADSIHGSKSASSPRQVDPARLGFGDRVQLVSVEGGWAKLARGYGYVRADKNQLVKGECRFRVYACARQMAVQNSIVCDGSNIDPPFLFLFSVATVGGSVDRACKLEAMLLALSNRRRELRMEQSKVDNKFIRLMSDLQVSLQTDEDLTVIMADTFSQPLYQKDDENTFVRKEEKKEASIDEYQGVDITKPAALNRQITPPNTKLRFGCFANGVFDSFDGDEGPAQGLLASLSHQSPTNADQHPPLETSASAPLFPAVANPSPSELRAGARAWRELHGRPAQGINFRTGMSGHMGLLSTQPKPHDLLETPEVAAPEPPTMSSRASAGLAPVNFRMSSHTGLTMSRSKGGVAGWIPSLGSFARTQDSADSVPTADSM